MNSKPESQSSADAIDIVGEDAIVGDLKISDKTAPSGAVFSTVSNKTSPSGAVSSTVSTVPSIGIADELKEEKDAVIEIRENDDAVIELR